jgi:hypothetical protein
MTSRPAAFRRLLAALAAGVVAFILPALAQQPRSPFDLPAPPRSPPFKWLNERGQEVECSVTPWQRVDLGTIASQRIYAGDHCSMPSSDPLSSAYKKVFSGSCDLHDICYFAPGNSKRFCDDMLKWRMDRDCERSYSNTLGKTQCHVAAVAWRKGLDTPISTQYWTRSQAWGRQNCRINAPAGAKAGVQWVKFTGAAMPADVVYASGAGKDGVAVCQADYAGGVHPGRVAGTNCNIGYGGREYGIGGSRVLVAKNTRWAALADGAPIPSNPVVGGNERGQPLTVCRARHQGSVYSGKVVAGHCNVGLAGRELTLRPFEILVSQ